MSATPRWAALRRLAVRLAVRVPRRAGGAGDGGAVAVWLLVIAPVLLAFAGLVLDGGRSISARQDAANLAEQAARSAVDQLSDASRASGSGGQFLQLDPAAARAAACSYVRSARAGAGCTTTLNGDGQVHVHVTVDTSTQILRVIGVGALHCAGDGQARPAFGATQEVRQ